MKKVEDVVPACFGSKTAGFGCVDCGHKMECNPSDIPTKADFVVVDGIKVLSGERRQFSTGATRQAAAGKGKPSLFPADAYIEICKHFEAGGVSHGDRNWEKGLPISCLIDSLERHIAALKMNLQDERHDRAIAWNAVCLLATIIRVENGLLPQELNDMPKYGEQK